jgi:hypothetical protein
MNKHPNQADEDEAPKLGAIDRVTSWANKSIETPEMAPCADQTGSTSPPPFH